MSRQLGCGRASGALCRVGCQHLPGLCPYAVDDGVEPQRAAAVLERLGPTLIKAGQLLAMRPDMIPAPHAEGRCGYSRTRSIEPGWPTAGPSR